MPKLTFSLVFQFLQHRARNRLAVHQMYSNSTLYFCFIVESNGEVYFDLYYTYCYIEESNGEVYFDLYYTYCYTEESNGEVYFDLS